MFYVYIIESLVDGDFYKGTTTDIEKRVQEHNDGLSPFTSTKKPWKLVFLKKFETKREALIEELRLKKCNKNYLKWLIANKNDL